MENKIQIINLVGNIFGVLFTIIFSQLKNKSFKEDFIKFEKSLERHFDINIKKRIIALAKNKELDLDSFRAHFSDEVSKINTINDLKKSYLQIKKGFNMGILIFLLSLLITIISILKNLSIIFSLDIWGFIILIIAIIIFIYYFIGFSKIETDLDRFILGEPMEKIIEERSEKIYGKEASKV